MISSAKTEGVGVPCDNYVRQGFFVYVYQYEAALINPLAIPVK